MERGIVKFPPHLIQRALDDCRSRFSVYHRSSDRELVIGDEVTKYSPTGWTADLLDWRTGEYRPAQVADMVEVVKICGARDEISCFMSPYICADIPVHQNELFQYKIGVEHSNKPMLLSVSDRRHFWKKSFIWPLYLPVVGTV